MKKILDITLFLKDNGTLNLSKLTKSQIGKQFLSDATILYGAGRPAQLAYRVLHNIKNLPYCQTCKLQLTDKNFIDFTRGYRLFCSNKCSANSQEKINQSILHVQSQTFIESRRKKIIERFGTKSMICINRDKATKTSIERYGVDNPLKSIFAKEQKEKFFLKKYGVDNPWKLSTVQDKCKQTLFDRYGVNSPLQLVDWSKIGITKPHQALIDFIRSIDPNLEFLINDRHIIDPYELDIYIPSKNIAIEFNGFYWHSEASGKSANYHLMKTNLCNLKGIKLIHVFEDEWFHKSEIVKSRISYLLGKSKRVFARNCSVKSIERDIEVQFLEDNHIQGKCRSSVRLGLFLQEQLVAVMTFGRPRFNKKYDWELLRYCSLKNISVIGGASKLLTAFLKTNNGSIISYADKRWSDGNLYKKIGFNLIGSSKPSYFYIDYKSMSRINRMNAQKHNLAKLLGDKFDETLSESKNMKVAGFDRIFDCGNLVFQYC